MKTITQKLFILPILCLFLYSCATDDSEEFNQLDNSVSDIELSYSQMEYEIIDLINDYRASNGLSNLSVLNLVSKEAVDHSKYMVKKGEVNHDNFNLRHQNLVVKASAKGVAENVAYGYNSAKSVVNAWLNSPSHKQNIENNSFTDFGISIKSDSDGKYYFTNIFIKK